MTFQITIQPGGYRFPAQNNETILDAALKNGYTLPYSCREGACSVCKGKVMEGHVDHGNHLNTALTDADKAAGLTLFCCAKPTSDVVIECVTASIAKDIPPRIMPCRVHKMTRMSDDLMVLQLELPGGERMRFFAGQHISILPKDQKPRHYSLANAPHDNEFLELHIRKVEGGVFTGQVFNEMKERDILRFKGPMGKFQLREDSEKPVIFVAGGSGFSAIKSLIEHALHIGIKRPMHLYWGARKPADLYMREKAESWESRGVSFTPVISEAIDGWSGRYGLVHQAVLDDFADLSGHEVYACGPSAMVDAARCNFTIQRGLPAESFFCDAPIPEFRSPFQQYQSPFQQSPSPFQQQYKSPFQS